MKVLILFGFILVHYVQVVPSIEEVGEESSFQFRAKNYGREYNEFLSGFNEAKASHAPRTCDNCSCFTDVIAKDLSPFKEGISEDLLRAADQRGLKYQLIDGVLYREKECLFPARCSGIEHFLNGLSTQLPDFEAIFNVHDWPQVSTFRGSPLPVFSFSKNSDHLDIMYPAWSFWEGGPAIKLYPTGLGRWDILREKLMKAAVQFPWEKKENKGFFRGSRTSGERDGVVLLSREDPDLVDAQYTKNQAWKSMKDTLDAPPAEETPLEEHCKYRYLYNFRGVAASFRFKHLFLCSSTVIHVGHDWKEFFYDSLTPWFHYVPLKENATPTEHKKILDFLKDHQDISKEIAVNGYEFIKEHLTLENINCYWKELIEQYSKLLTFKPTLDHSLIKVSKT